VAENLNAAWQDMPRNLQRSYGAAFNYLCIFTVNLALFQLSFSRRFTAFRERQLSDAQTTAQKAQLAALRYQLNPHFLFNALNSISALIVTKRNDDAEAMTEKLSSFLRNSLAFDPNDLVALDEELALVEDYLDIETIRFGNKLIVDIACDPEAGAASVPVFLLQPLVENAVKHGVAHSKEPVTICVCAEIADGLLSIRVENDRVEADEYAAEPKGAGVGLENVRQRLKAVYGDRASLSVEPGQASFCARLSIPAA
jgi:LytS/YehU family sensor histidine kinase